MSAMILFGGWCWFVIVALDDCAVLGFSPSLLKSMNNLERMQAVQRLVSRSDSKETRLSAGVAVTPGEGASSDAVEEGTQHDDQNTLTALSRKEEKTIKIIAVRHAISQANEFMHQPGNRWGDATFRDDLSLVDSPLSERGMQQVEQILFPRMKRLLEEMIAADASQSRDWLVLISPLTRCLQTYMLGVRPALQQVMIPSSKITTMVVPLLRERVYTCSDTGRVRSVLEAEFTSRCPEIDWSLVPDSAWWYTDAAVATSTTIPAANSKSQECTQQNENDPKEWRPSGEGQHYEVPGEPLCLFQQRLADLDEWLVVHGAGKVVLIVTHWGIVRHYTAREIENCGICRWEIDRDGMVVPSTSQHYMEP